MSEDVSSAKRERMLIEITLGKVPEANTPAEREVREILTREVAEIRAKGGTVMVPHDIS